MKNRYYIAILLFSTFIFIANSSQHPTNPNGGFTGAPLDGVCLECHINQNNNLSGSYFIEGIPEVAFTGESYPLKIFVTNPKEDAVRAGFQLVALEKDLTNAGEFQPDGGNILLKNAKGRSYLGHAPAVVFDAERIASWLAFWTPTESDTGIVTFYGAAMIGNGSDGNRRDRAIFRRWETEIKSPEEGVDVQIIVSNPLMCGNVDDAKLSLITYGGIEPLSYAWNNGSDTSELSDIGPGTYTINVTDALGNMDSDTLEIPSLDSIVIDNIEIIQPSSQSNLDGSISVSIAGGIPPYTIEWISVPSSEIIGDSMVLEGLGAGDYQAIITDDNNCSLTSEIFQLSFNTAIMNVESVVNIFPNPTSGVLNIDSEAVMTDYKLIDLSGKILYEGRIDNSQRIDLTSINLAGIYILVTKDPSNNIYGYKVAIY